jgi:hypothetical protein
MFGPAGDLATRLPPVSRSADVATIYPNLHSQTFIGFSRLDSTDSAVGTSECFEARAVQRDNPPRGESNARV